MLKKSRTPAIMADAAYVIMNKRSQECTGQFFIDDEVLAAAGVTDFERYNQVAGESLYVDIFVDPDSPAPTPVKIIPQGLMP